jgi:4,5-dihydroxyphthalate decarboxylase
MLPLTLACWNYDRTAALFDGRVKPDNIALDMWSTRQVGEIMERMVQHRQFDVSELGITYYIRSLELHDKPFIAIPVFPNRFFRHSSVFVNVAANISSPRDLQGKRVGELHRYGHDAGIWAKGAFSDDFGVSAQSQIHFVGGLDHPVTKPDWAPFEAPQNVEINHLGPEQTLSDMLDHGEIDALYSAQVPVCYRYGSKKVRRLFPDFEPVEADYYRRTRVFPIMHTVVIRREVYEQNRWIALALTKAFEDAKNLAMNGYGMSDVFFNAPQMTPWFAGLRERVKNLMGDDFWPYGVAANRKTLETCLRYHYEQGLTKRLLKVEELFAPETLG